ncbi:MAG: carboxypeptidase-like regulatory domain-containing protein, partial [Rhodothermales bacterium]|nr:carboxypeptidase-like regulatory domain-containing protein [Rhodothermales bacterium]
MRARLALLALSLAVPLGASAQHATVHGRVVDDETGAPLPGAHVIVAGTMLGTAAGPDGHYRLGRVPAGAHRL